MSILRSASQFVGEWKQCGGIEKKDSLVGVDVESPQMNTGLAFKPFSGFWR